ncbi:MAG: Peptide methionine sulfoxide reductase MsrA [Cyanobacteriota bacterium]|jgi:peptide-methionine (S)-S-oxide reductase
MLMTITLPKPLRRQGLWIGLLISGIIFGLFSVLINPTARAIPDPAIDIPKVASNAPQTAKAVFAGGCFWGLEAMFEEVRGVQSVQTGYSGGSAETANYPRVSGGGTDHAESIQIVYDPAQVSYGELLKIFFSVGHDPTQVNRQGADMGRQYRSAIFATTPEQKQVAAAYIKQLETSDAFDQAIATEVNEFKAFYPAEDYHQDFVKRNPAHPYVLVHDIPKLQKFRQTYPDLLSRNGGGTGDRQDSDVSR